MTLETLLVLSFSVERLTVILRPLQVCLTHCIIRRRLSLLRFCCNLQAFAALHVACCFLYCSCDSGLSESDVLCFTTRSVVVVVVVVCYLMLMFGNGARPAQCPVFVYSLSVCLSVCLNGKAGVSCFALACLTYLSHLSRWRICGLMRLRCQSVRPSVRPLVCRQNAYIIMRFSQKLSN